MGTLVCIYRSHWCSSLIKFIISSPIYTKLFYRVNTTIYGSMSDYAARFQEKDMWFINQAVSGFDYAIVSIPSKLKSPIDQATHWAPKADGKHFIYYLITTPTIAKDNPEQAVVAIWFLVSYNGKKDQQQKKKLTISLPHLTWYIKKEYTCRDHQPLLCTKMAI
jgi:hypothetical protein